MSVCCSSQIVRGAAESLSESIGLLTFENQAGREFNFSFVDQMDRAGFSCFGTSKLGLLKVSIVILCYNK